VSGKILIGTASWTDHEPFYPSDVTGTERLGWYSARFPYVEIDSSYYHVPGSKVTAAWAQRTPDDFVMGIKAHKSMTLHERQGGVPVPPTEATIRDFENALYPLRQSGKLGAILYQWPPWFKPSEASFEELLKTRERHPEDRVAIEFRHRDWGLGETWERVIDLLSEANLTYCCVDEPQHGSGTMSRVVAATTPQLAMLRLHGRNAGTWYKRVEKTGHRFDYVYAAAEIEEIAANIRLLAELAETVHIAINTNNNSQGPINALALAEELRLPYQNPELLAELRTAVGLPSDR